VVEEGVRGVTRTQAAAVGIVLVAIFGVALVAGVGQEPLIRQGTGGAAGSSAEDVRMSDGLYALIGVALGGLITAVVPFFLQRAAETRRWAREDARLYHPERIEAYKAFARAVSRFTLARDVPNPYAKREEQEALTAERLRLMAEAYSDAYTFASPPVAGAAHRLLDAALDDDKVDDAREEFLEAVHKELGVPLGAADS
jgi:hypothetical protein